MAYVDVYQMRSNGGRRMTLSACFLVLAMLGAACTGGSDSDKAEDVPDDIDAEVSVGGGSSGGLSESLFSLDVGVVGSGGSAGPGLSVRGTASGTVPADVAFVVVVPPGGIEALGEGSMTPEDRKAVLDGLAAMGVARGDVTFETDPRFGQQRVQVKVPVAQLAARGPRIVASVEKTLGRSDSAGATFALSNCEPAAAPLRKEAMAQAEAQAKALADAGKLGIGGIVAIRQEAEAGFLRAAPPSGVCPLVATGRIDPFDARPEVRLSLAVDVTYAITGAPAGSQGRPTLFAAGSATARAKADEAYVLVLFESEDEEPTGGPSAQDRTRVLEALDKLKVDRKNVEITTRSDYGVTTVVQVETKTAGLATAGTDIVRAVEDVLGRSDISGVRFWSSSCAGLLAKARKDAVGDARQRAGALAEAAGVKLGDLQWLSEATTGCDDSIDAALSLDDYTSSPLHPFDAEPEFTLTISAHVGFLIG